MELSSKVFLGFDVVNEEINFYLVYQGLVAPISIRNACPQEIAIIAENIIECWKVNKLCEVTFYFSRTCSKNGIVKPVPTIEGSSPKGGFKTYITFEDKCDRAFFSVCFPSACC